MKLSGFVAILALSSYAELGEKVMIACLPSEGSNDPSPGTMGKVKSSSPHALDRSLLFIPIL